MHIIRIVKKIAKKKWLGGTNMKQIKLTKCELEMLFINYSSTWRGEDERLVDVCRDLDHANDDDLLEIYNAFCKYLGVGGMRVYRMSEFNELDFEDNIELKRLTENVDLDDMYFSMNLNGYVGYYSFNDLKTYLKYRIPLSLNQIKNMLEYTFEDEEEGEEDE